MKLAQWILQGVDSDGHKAKSRVPTKSA